MDATNPEVQEVSQQTEVEVVAEQDTNIDEGATSEGEIGSQGTELGGNADDSPTSEAKPEEKPKYKVKVSGEELEVDVDELINGYSRTSDYTRKAQEVAEQRKAVEAEREAIANQAKAEREYIQELAQVVALDNSIKEYEKLNWQQLNAQDPVQAQALFFQYQQLKDARNAAAGQIQQKELTRKQQEEHKALEAQQTTAKQIQECYATVAREIKGWGPELAKQLDKTASEFGFTNDDLRQVKDPRFIKLLHEAHLGRQLLKKQTPPTPKPQQPPKPVPQVGTGGAPARKDPERMSVDEWMKTRRQQVHGK